MNFKQARLTDRYATAPAPAFFDYDLTYLTYDGDPEITSASTLYDLDILFFPFFLNAWILKNLLTSQSVLTKK